MTTRLALRLHGAHRETQILTLPSDPMKRIALYALAATDFMYSPLHASCLPANHFLPRIIAVHFGPHVRDCPQCHSESECMLTVLTLTWSAVQSPYFRKRYHSLSLPSENLRVRMPTARLMQWCASSTTWNPTADRNAHSTFSRDNVVWQCEAILLQPVSLRPGLRVEQWLKQQTLKVSLDHRLSKGDHLTDCLTSAWCPDRSSKGKPTMGTRIRQTKH